MDGWMDGCIQTWVDGCVNERSKPRVFNSCTTESISLDSLSYIASSNVHIYVSPLPSVSTGSRGAHGA